MDVYDEYLIEEGFEVFEPELWPGGDIESCFRKDYNDEIGKKYVLKVYKHRLTDPDSEIKTSVSYTYRVRLYKSYSRQFIDLNFHPNWKLNDVERYLQLLFNTGMFDYCETFDKQDA